MERIHEIIGKHLRSESTKGEESILNKWIEEEESNQLLFQEAKTLWNESSYLRKEKNIEVEEAWLKFLNQTGRNPKQNQRILPPFILKRLAVAASLFLAAFFMYFYLSDFHTDVKFQASKKAVSNIELPDGSIVWLNKGATLEFEESKGYRNIKLNGQAYFNVSHKPHKPFIISTGNLKTQVVGTSFDIDYRNKEHIEVSAVSGKVKVYENSNEDAALLLTKGLGASYHSGNHKLNLIEILDQNFLAWKTGVLRFNNTPMLKVAETLSMHYGLLVLVDDSDETSRLTAEFDNLKIDEVIELIQLTTDVNLSTSFNNKSNIR